MLLQQLPMRHRQVTVIATGDSDITHWQRKQNGESGPEEAKCLLNLEVLSVNILTWSNCASSPLWRDRDRGFSCNIGESQRVVKEYINQKPLDTVWKHISILLSQSNKTPKNLLGFSKTSLSQLKNLSSRFYLQSHSHHCCWTICFFQCCHQCLHQPPYTLSLVWTLLHYIYTHYSTEPTNILQWQKTIHVNILC